MEARVHYSSKKLVVVLIAMFDFHQVLRLESMMTVEE